MQPSPRRSFAEVLSSSPTPSPISIDAPVPLDSRMGTHRGFPAVYFTQEHVRNISSPYLWTLVGKFAYGYNKQNSKLGRPSMEELNNYFASLDLKGDF